MSDLHVIDLFSGIGGFSLGLHQADPRFKTIAFCEIDPFCQKVLQKNFPGVKIHDDIKNFKTTETAFIITGGFPCVSFSQAGKRKGTKDHRYLWGEMFAVIKQVKPRWVIAENVRGIVTTQDGLAFDQVHSDLESENYEIAAFNIPAVGKGAWHRRERIFFIANLSDTNKRDAQTRCERQGGVRKESEGERISSDASSLRETLSDSDSRLRGRRRAIAQSGKKQVRRISVEEEKSKCETQDIWSKTIGCDAVFRETENWWQTESKLRGVPPGISEGLDKIRTKRIMSLGNAVVPQVVEEIGRAIIKAEFKDG